MSISSNYNHQEIEKKWYSHWMKNDYFSSSPDDREPYSIVIPPPNITGVLHMGHMLNNTIQDILIRRARLLGKNQRSICEEEDANMVCKSFLKNKKRSNDD